MATRIISPDVAVFLRKADLGAIHGRHIGRRWTIWDGLIEVTEPVDVLETAGLLKRGELTGGDIFPRRNYQLTNAGRTELNRYIRKLHADQARAI